MNGFAADHAGIQVKDAKEVNVKKDGVSPVFFCLLEKNDETISNHRLLSRADPPVRSGVQPVHRRHRRKWERYRVPEPSGRRKGKSVRVRYPKAGHRKYKKPAGGGRMSGQYGIDPGFPRKDGGIRAGGGGCSRLQFRIPARRGSRMCHEGRDQHPSHRSRTASVEEGRIDEPLHLQRRRQRP